MSRPRLLVTGIGGAVGGELAVALARDLPKAELIGVFSADQSRADFLARACPTVAAAFRPVVCDLGDPAAVAVLARTLGPAGPTLVVHAAANVSWTASAQAAWAGNVELTRNTATLARALTGARFLLVSSAYTATSGWVYRNVYEETKAAAERMLRAEFADLSPTVFSCSLVVGHSVTGRISRFHGIYPLLGLLDRHPMPFLPGDRHGRIDIVPVDWVADELVGMVRALLSGRPVDDVVAAAGDDAPLLGELVPAVIEALNRIRLEQDRAPLGDVPLVPFRRWDFLRRSVDAWNVTSIPMPNRDYLQRLIGVYRPYFENATARPPHGVSTDSPPWRDYLDVVVRGWAAGGVRRPERTSAGGAR